jgi:hypothetical protein
MAATWLVQLSRRSFVLPTCIGGLQHVAQTWKICSIA